MGKPRQARFRLHSGSHTSWVLKDEEFIQGNSIPGQREQPVKNQQPVQRHRSVCVKESTLVRFMARAQRAKQAIVQLFRDYGGLKHEAGGPQESGSNCRDLQEKASRPLGADQMGELSACHQGRSGRGRGRGRGGLQCKESPSMPLMKVTLHLSRGM